eukprot:6413615-Prymnesium_polylepis.1
MLVGRKWEPQQRVDAHEELLAGAANKVGLARAIVVVVCRVIALAPVIAARYMPGYGPTKSFISRMSPGMGPAGPSSIL